MNGIRLLSCFTFSQDKTRHLLSYHYKYSWIRRIKQRIWVQQRLSIIFRESDQVVKDFVQAFEAIRNAWSLEGRGREMRSLLRSARQTARNGHTIPYTLVQYLCSYTLPDGVGNSLRASSPIWESDASRARTRARAGPPSPLARLLFTISPNGELARRLGWKLVDG